MLEDLDFLAGNREALKGRAVIFTENQASSDNPFNPRFPAIAVAADPSDLLALLSSLMPMPESMREGMLDRIRQSADVWSRTMFGRDMYRFAREAVAHSLDQIALPQEMKDQIREEMENIPDEPMGVPVHVSFVPLVGFDPGAIEPYEQICDVARAEAVPSITYAGLVLAGFAQHYLALHLLQREQAGSALGAGTDHVAIANAKDLSPAEFLALLNRKVSELMYARETGDRLERLILELRRLTAGTVFIRDVLNLANFFETSHPRKVEIMDLYLRRISLLAAEKYEEIPELDRTLAGLLEG